MKRLQAVQNSEDIPSEFKDSPVGDLLFYHNCKKEHKSYAQAELLIGMCMDSRMRLNIPDNFAFIIRSGGADLRSSEFKVSYALALAGLEYIALIGHTQCGMVNLGAQKEKFVQGLCTHAGWETGRAERYFEEHSPEFEIGNAIDFILSETARLSLRYPKVKVAPLLYKVEDNLLYWIHKP